MARGPDVLEFARRAEAYDHPVDRDRPERAPPRRPAPVPIQPRNPHFEGLLCRAVDQRVLVELRYDDDPAPRLFAPHVVYSRPWAASTSPAHSTRTRPSRSTATSRASSRSA